MHGMKVDVTKKCNRGQEKSYARVKERSKRMVVVMVRKKRRMVVMVMEPGTRLGQ